MKYRTYSKTLIISLLSFALIASCSQSKQSKKPASIGMADSEISRNPSAWMIDFQKKPKWAYVNGLVCQAMLEVWRVTGDRKYFNYARGYADSLIDKNGQILGYKKEDYNLDKLNSGKMLFTLFKETGDKRYKTAIETLRAQLVSQPRTSQGGFWHKQIYPNQMWLDGIYMGTPFYAQYAATFGDTLAFDDIALQFELLHADARDSATGWYYHGWDASKKIFWADPVTGLSKNFWGRGVGWYYMALVDVLDFFPEDHPKRSVLLNIYKDLTTTITSNQDTTSGVWYQVLDRPSQEGNYPEATASAMFTYGLIKGIHKNYLSEQYLSNAKRAYQGMIDTFIRNHPDGTLELINCCAGAGLGPADNPVRDGTYEYYINEKRRSNDGKGTGPFIMASLIFETNPKFQSPDLND